MIFETINLSKPRKVLQQKINDIKFEMKMKGFTDEEIEAYLLTSMVTIIYVYTMTIQFCPPIFKLIKSAIPTGLAKPITEHELFSVIEKILEV